MHAIARALGFLCGVGLAVAQQHYQRFERVEPVMGTLFRVTLYAESEPRASAALDAAFATARQLDAALSDYKDDSELNRLCRARHARLSPELYTVLETALDVARKTGGAFDPTVGPLVRLWRDARRSGVLPPAELAAARRRTGWQRVRLDRSHRTATLRTPNMQLDLGGIAKGYAADTVLATLAGHRIHSALVAASGDLAIGDPPPGRSGWTVSLGATGETRTLARCGVSTSGDAEQYALIGGVRYSHIVDPRTGLGLGNRFSVTVIAPSGILADSLATAFSVLGPGSSKARHRYWPTVQWIVHSGEKTNAQ